MEPIKKEKKHKEKRRSNEKRKERSRDAARCRRSRETDIFTELAAALPVAPEQAAHLDKASVMRLAIAYLKVRAVVDSIPGPLTKSEASEEMDELFPKALNGFMLVLSCDGNMIYLSENVSDYLGVSQMDMMGQSVFEYSHPCDHDELRECLSSKPLDEDDKRTYSFFLRLKCTLTNKGRKVNLKSASYKVIHCTGRLVQIRDTNSNITEVDNEKPLDDSEDEIVQRETGASLVLVGCPIPHPSNIEIPLGRDTFLSKHNLNMKFTYADEKLAEYLGWDSEELMGQSVFDFHHALDNLALDKSFKSLFSKGQCETVAYRFLGKRGGYAWVVTQATLIHCSKQQKPISVVCVNYVLSGLEQEDEVYSVRQLAARNSGSVVKSEKADVCSATPDTLLQINNDENGKKVIYTSTTVEQDRSLTLTENRAKPNVVTTTIFRSAAKRKEPVQDQENIEQNLDGSRKEDNTFPRPVPNVEGFVELFDESCKENDEPAAKRPNRTRIVRQPFVFQGKTALEYSPELFRKNQAQTVTKQLFTPVSEITQQQQPDQLPSRPAPQTATASIFAPRTEDMNKGFLTFSEDQPGLTMLKDEPEDLTHLAPTPGDVCVPLEDTPFLSDMLDEFILGDNYCPLLSPNSALTQELRVTDLGDPMKSGDLTDTSRNKDLVDPLADCDPFMYDDSPTSPCSMDPNAVSPSLVEYRQISLSDSQSPERSIDSLGSPTECSRGEGLSEDEMFMLGIGESSADDELSLRAPYIPMSDQDEALELLISDDMVMWGADNKSSSKWLMDEKEDRISDSSLAQLLRTDQIGTRGYNDHGGGLVNPVQVLGQIPRKNAFPESNNRWSTKANRIDKPSKRIHNSSTSICTENKRIKCDEMLPSNMSDSFKLEEHLLGKQQSIRNSPNLTGSQLLRRLVSQQTVPQNHCTNSIPNNNSNNDVNDNNNRRNEINNQRNVLQGDREEEIDRGRNEERRCYDGFNNTLQSTNTQTNRNQPCNSVLMNLLVSGCDDSTLNSRNVPSLSRKDLTTPLSVDLDNQTVPQLPSNNSNNLNLDHLSPDIRRQLTSSFVNGVMTLASPPSNMISFDCLDYDDVDNGSPGLLQVGTELFGSLLDRNLV